MRIGIIQFPGSNCERETALAVKRAGMEPIDFLWNENPQKLDSCSGFIIVGGFSYQDRSRAGVIAAFDPVIEVLKQQSEQGKPILGICNGAQILVESGLVPGFENCPLSMALTHNKRILNGQVLGVGYYNVWTYLKATYPHKKNAFTSCFDNEPIMYVPLAHAEGRFVANHETLQTLVDENMIAFQYCDAQGEVIDNFPVNPNGSLYNIAAVCNPAGNVMAMMPHPERTPNGDRLFQSMRQYIQENAFVAKGHKRENKDNLSLLWQEIPSYSKQPQSISFLVEQVISDDEAISVEATLNTNNIDVSLKKFTHWEIVANSQSAVYQAQACGALYNDRKEFTAEPSFNSNTQAVLLIRLKDDILGLQKMQQLKHHYHINDLEAIKSGTVWVIEAKSKALNSVVQQVIDSGILFNPLSYECYRYA